MEDDSVELMESYYKENIPFTNKTPIKRPPPSSSSATKPSTITESADRRTVTPNTTNKQQSTSTTTSSCTSCSSSSLLLPPRPPSIKKLVKPSLLPPPSLPAPAHHRYQTPKKPFKPPSRITPKSVSSSESNAQSASTDEKNMTVKTKSYYNSTFDRLKNRNNNPVAVVTDEKKPLEEDSNADYDENNNENNIPEEEKFDPIYQKPLPRRQYDSKLRKAFFR
jgi:hypothetical protein